MRAATSPPLAARPGLTLVLLIFGLLAINAAHLVDPPYWDGIIGIYMQGTWLARNGLDHLALVSQPSFAAGGPKLSAINGFAAIFALGIEHLGRTGTYLLLHLITIVSAAVAGQLAATATQRAGVRGAWRWVLGGMALPVFCAQTAGTYVEVPLAMAFVVCFEAIQRRRYGLAAAVGCAAFTVKYSATLLAAALLAWVLFRIVVGMGLLRLPRAVALPSSLLWLLLPLGVIAFQTPRQTPWEFLGAYPAMRVRLFMSFSPVFSTMLAATIPGCLATLAYGPTRRAALADVEGFFQTAFLTILVWGYIAGAALYPLPLVRYHATIILPCFILWARLAKLWGFERALPVAGVGLIIFGVVNSHGALLPDIGPAQARSGDALERSREWLTDLRANQELARVIESHRGEVVIADQPFVHMLAWPELGYVDVAHEPLMSFENLPFGEVQPTSMAAVDDPQTLVVYGSVLQNILRLVSLKPGPEARVVYLSEQRGGINVIYRGFPKDNLMKLQRR